MAPQRTGDDQQGQPETHHETGAAFMIVDSRGTVVRATGWEKTFGVGAPERITPPGGAPDRLLACMVEAIDEAGTTGGLARRTAHLEDPPRKVDIAAASLAIGGGGMNTAVIVQTRSESAVGGSAGDEGKAIRRLEHDLRSPMTSISGAAELLESARIGAVNPQQRKCLGVIHKGVDTMLGLLESAAAPYRQARALSNEPFARSSDGEKAEKTR